MSQSKHNCGYKMHSLAGGNIGYIVNTSCECEETVICLSISSHSHTIYALPFYHQLVWNGEVGPIFQIDISQISQNISRIFFVKFVKYFMKFVKFLSENIYNTHRTFSEKFNSNPITFIVFCLTGYNWIYSPLPPSNYNEQEFPMNSSRQALRDVTNSSRNNPEYKAESRKYFVFIKSSSLQYLLCTHSL